MWELFSRYGLHTCIRAVYSKAQVYTIQGTDKSNRVLEALEVLSTHVKIRSLPRRLISLLISMDEYYDTLNTVITIILDHFDIISILSKEAGRQIAIYVKKKEIPCIFSVFISQIS